MVVYYASLVVHTYTDAVEPKEYPKPLWSSNMEKSKLTLYYIIHICMYISPQEKKKKD